MPEREPGPAELPLEESAVPEDAGTPGARLADALREKVAGGGKLLIPYVTGGLPGVDGELLGELEGAGADAVEVGLPYSDPVMDGPVIQEASRRALEAGARPRGVLRTVRHAELGVPVALMTYVNPVLAYQERPLLADALAAGVGGMIVPDLPFDEAESWSDLCARAGMATIFLAAPGAGTERLKAVADASRGFVYCISTFGVTGVRAELSGSARSVVEALRPLTDLPLVVGVGISSPAQAAEACEFADGVVVGSALVRLLLSGEREAAAGLTARFRAAID